jgi:hypothetical protein
MKKAQIEKIIAYFEENEDIFNDCIEELDNYNGYLGDNRYYPMDELDDLMELKSATELLNMAFVGHDEDTHHTDGHGNVEYGAFNPNRNYFTFNGYGNLISTDYPDYSANLDSYCIMDMCEYRYYIDTIDKYPELSALFDDLEEIISED